MREVVAAAVVAVVVTMAAAAVVAVAEVTPSLAQTARAVRTVRMARTAKTTDPRRKRRASVATRTVAMAPTSREASTAARASGTTGGNDFDADAIHCRGVGEQQHQRMPSTSATIATHMRRSAHTFAIIRRDDCANACGAKYLLLPIAGCCISRVVVGGTDIDVSPATRCLVKSGVIRRTRGTYAAPLSQTAWRKLVQVLLARLGVGRRPDCAPVGAGCGTLDATLTDGCFART